MNSDDFGALCEAVLRRVDFVQNEPRVRLEFLSADSTRLINFEAIEVHFMDCTALSIPNIVDRVVVLKHADILSEKKLDIDRLPFTTFSKEMLKRHHFGFLELLWKRLIAKELTLIELEPVSGATFLFAARQFVMTTQPFPPS